MTEDGTRRERLRRSLAPRLGGLGTPLELIAEDVMGEEDAAIDWIAAAPDGTAWIVLVEPEHAGPELLVRGLVQRAWVSARIADWCKMAPSLALRCELAPRVLLVARDFDRTLRIAAREASENGIALARWSGDGERPELEPIEAPARARRAVPSPTPAPPRVLASVFRSGLSDADLLG